ncbi:3-phosphoshikimate 1-carboxyvinyltransferase [Desulfobacterota bacterium AH_259_B03_O07]|nr:3-phosphoshikimate 1-carboxyvinyltransferase [Desulfobacterota bacterium AH_259_B03_O07]
MRGELAPPGDKSISHRAIILGSLAQGLTTVRGFLSSEDTLSSAKAMMKLGVPIEINKETVKIRGKGSYGLSEPDDIIDAGNSGTTARILTGLLSSQNFFSSITGDQYLRTRPMDRVVKPLTRMGARIWGRDEGRRLPLAFLGSELKAIKYSLPVASAQVKSAILLAGLYAVGETEVVEPNPTRDHTERMLSYLGVRVERNSVSIKMEGPQQLKEGREISIPADISSASFLIVAALINPNSEILIKNVGINPQRTGAIEILKKMEGNIEILNKREACGEEIGDILVRSSTLIATEIKGEIIPKTIDELPVVAVAACFADGETLIKDAEELRVKETDRIKAITTELAKFGADIEELDDGMIINGRENLKGTKCTSWGDHRIAMALTIAGTRADGQTEIEDSECVSVSFPGFFTSLNNLRK